VVFASPFLTGTRTARRGLVIPGLLFAALLGLGYALNGVQQERMRYTARATLYRSALFVASRAAARFSSQSVPERERGAAVAAPRRRRRSESSALGELEAPARLALAVLLALDDAGVAGQEARGLERGPSAGVEELERLGDAVLDRAAWPDRPPPRRSP
jgi:hypothetical protein